MLFRDIPGNFTEKEILLRRISSGHIPHAQLFHGPSGSSHLALALASIQHMLCQNPGKEDACGTCPSCAKVAKHIHPDVHFSFPVVPKKSGDKPTSDDYLDTWRTTITSNPYVSYIDWMQAIGAENRQGNITREECRSIVQKLGLKAFEGDAKFLVMWLPEFLGKEGNALLKLIEEPPENTYFFFVSENLDSILPTILSRTQVTKIQPFQFDELKTYVETHFEEVDAESIAFLADGDLNRAQHLALHTEANLTEQFKTWMRLCFRKDVPKLIQWSDEIGSVGRENIKNFLKYGLAIIREVLSYKTIPGYRIKLGQREAEFVANFSNVVQFANIEVLYEGLNQCVYEIERNANPKLTLFQLSLSFRDTFMEMKKKV